MDGITVLAMVCGTDKQCWMNWPCLDGWTGRDSTGSEDGHSQLGSRLTDGAPVNAGCSTRAQERGEGVCGSWFGPLRGLVGFCSKGNPLHAGVLQP